ncbi:MAG TPA: hypothetical protein VE990_01160 [Acidimicrobiales bacterium]|nr:hypothetical protein [Acidimicrobiales bacterium]
MTASEIPTYGDAPDTEPAEPRAPAPTGPGWARRLDGLRRPTSPALVYAGAGAIAIGFLLIGIGWYQVSGLANVALQMPYLVSAAMTGLGLIVIGVTAIAIAAKRQEAAERRRRLDNLEALLSQLRPPAVTAEAPKRTRTRSARS